MCGIMNYSQDLMSYLRSGWNEMSQPIEASAGRRGENSDCHCHTRILNMYALLLIFTALVVSLQSARAEELRTVYGKTVEEWIHVFRDKGNTKAERQRAILALGYFGPEARAVVPDLIEIVRHEHDQQEDSYNIKASAVNLLVEIGEGTGVTVPYLIDFFLKQGCLRLTGMGTIVYSAGVQNNLVRIGGSAVPALLDILKGSDRDMRVCAAEVLGDIGPAARAAIPALIHAVEHPATDQDAKTLSRHAALALGRIGPEAKSAAPALTALLDKADDQYVDGGIVYFEVVMALDGIGVHPVRKLLDSLVRDRDPTRSRMMSLIWLGQKAHAAIPGLRVALMDERPRVRISAAVVLANIEPKAKEAIPVLIEGLKPQGDDEYYHEGVFGALAHLGPQANAALPELIRIVTEGNAESDILEALVQIDPEGKDCVPALITALKSKEVEFVHAAANYLSLLGPRAEAAIPALAETITRDDNYDGDFYNSYHPQVTAARALRRIGPGAKTAIPVLIKALKYRRIIRPRFDDDDEERDCSAAAAAAQVLGSFGTAAKDAVPALIEAAQTREKDEVNWPVRKAAILALGQIGPDAKAAIPVLRNLMEEDGKDSDCLPQLVASLSQLAPDGKELADRWLTNQAIRFTHGDEFDLKDRSLVLGIMGRSSLEADGLTRDYLDKMNPILASRDPRDDGVEILEEWFEILYGLGHAGRMAIPYLNEYRKHPSPLVRMWATEALERIKQPAIR